MASRVVMATHGRRGFAIAAVGLVALTVLAVGPTADGKNGGSSDQAMKIATVAAHKANLEGLRTALMPLLMFVKGGQPRDTLRSMAAGDDTPVSAAVMESVSDAVKSAVENLGKMPVRGGDAARSRDAARSATELYGEAVGIAEDAANLAAADRARKVVMAAVGVRLLGLGDALFDQSRRLSGGTIGGPGDITVNGPAAVPDLDMRTRLKPGDEKAIARAIARKIRAEADLPGTRSDRSQRLRGIADRLLELAA